MITIIKFYPEESKRIIDFFGYCKGDRKEIIINQDFVIVTNMTSAYTIINDCTKYDYVEGNENDFTGHILIKEKLPKTNKKFRDILEIEITPNDSIALIKCLGKAIECECIKSNTDNLINLFFPIGANCYKNVINNFISYNDIKLFKKLFPEGNNLQMYQLKQDDPIYMLHENNLSLDGNNNFFVFMPLVS